METLSPVILLLLVVMVAAIPYVAKIRHSSQTFLAAYLIFSVVFLSAFLVLFNAGIYLLRSRGLGELLEQTGPLVLLLVVTFLLSSALATWQARKPHVTRKPR